MAIDTAKVTTTINAPPDEVWAALTRPETIKQYFFDTDVETDWEEGGPIRFSGEYEGKSYVDKGEVIEFDPERHLSFSHWSSMTGEPDIPENYHRVDYDLEPVGDGATKLTVRQETKGSAGKAESEKNWTTVIQGLKRVVED